MFNLLEIFGFLLIFILENAGLSNFNKSTLQYDQSRQGFYQICLLSNLGIFNFSVAVEKMSKSNDFIPARIEKCPGTLPCV